MKLKISLLAGLAALGFASTASAQTVISITGATAFRAAAHTSIINVLGGSGVTQYGFVGSSLSNANHAIFKGNIGGDWNTFLNNTNDLDPLIAIAVAANILGAGEPYQAKPWFWSDQYDLKLQIAGLNTGYDRIVTRKGEGDAASFWYYRGDDLLAVDAMNDSRAYMVGKRLIEMGKSPAPEVIVETPDLKALLKA